LEPQWSEDGAQKERAEMRRIEIMRRGLRMAPEKVRRREHRHLPLVSIVVLFSNRIFIFLFSVK